MMSRDERKRWRKWRGREEGEGMGEAKGGGGAVEGKGVQWDGGE